MRRPYRQSPDARMPWLYIYLAIYVALVAGALLALAQSGALRQIPAIWTAIGIAVAVALGLVLALTTTRPEPPSS